MANSNNTNCFRDLIVLKNIGTEFTLLYMTAGCNVLLLILNITILYAVIGYMKPTISEIRKQTFIIMDNILLSYIPAGIRETLGCKPEIKIDGRGQQTKGNKTSKGTTKTAASKTSKASTGTAKTIGTTGATSE